MPTSDFRGDTLPRTGAVSASPQIPARTVAGVVAGWLSSRPLAVGALGASLLGIGALGIGVMPARDPLGPLTGVYLLRSWPTARLGLGLAAIAGVAVLLVAWLGLGRALRSGGGPSLRRLQVGLAAWSLPLVFVPPIFSRDLYSYAAQAHLLHVGHDPYQVGPWVEPGAFADSVDPMWSATKTPYGPVFLWLGHGISQVGGESVFATVVGMRLLAVAGVVLLAVFLPRLAQHFGVDPRAALWLGLLNPLTLMHFVGGGHNDALMIGLVLAGLALAVEGHPVAGSIGIALAAGVKAPAAIAIAFVGHLWADRLSGRGALVRGFAGASAVGLATFGVITAATGLGYGWISALGTPATVRTWLSPPTALGMAAGLVGRGLGLGDHTYELVTESRLVFGAVAVLLMAALCLRRRGLTPLRATGLALLAVVLLGPVVQPWYLMWPLILLAAAGLRGREPEIAVWGVVAITVVSQLNGSMMRGPIAVPGTVLVLAVTWTVLVRAGLAGRGRDPEDGVRHLAAPRPVQAQPEALAEQGYGALPALARVLP